MTPDLSIRSSVPMRRRVPSPEPAAIRKMKQARFLARLEGLVNSDNRNPTGCIVPCYP